MLAESIRAYAAAALAPGSTAAQAAAVPPALLRDAERLQTAAAELEAALFEAHTADGAAYKAQTRALVTALKVTARPEG